MVYFAQRASGGPIKITATMAPIQNALAYLISKHKCEFRILGVVDDHEFSARELHDRFSHMRLGGRTWFEARPSLLGFISKHCRPYEPPPKGIRRPPGLPKPNPSVAKMARRVAAERGITLAQYIDEMIRPQVVRDWLALLKRDIEANPDWKRQMEQLPPDDQAE